ncbi:MAG: YaaR family protein, partial [Clostridiales bacterium]|nr:YaaR family protein [Clostridiales bacterium]
MEVKISQARPVDMAHRTEGRKKVEDGDFRFTLSRLSDENLAGRLEALMGDIAAQGKQLADHMDIKDMRKYRSLVSDFIGEVVPRSHKFQRE